MRWTCARVLCQDEGATLADIREAVTMLEDAARTCRRVLGGAHPTTEGVEDSLREAQTALHSSEAPHREQVRHRDSKCTSRLVVGSAAGYTPGPK